MAQQITKKEVLSFAAGLSAEERTNLIRLIATLPNADERFAYSLQPPGADEFNSDEDGLAWEGEGWDEFE